MIEHLLDKFIACGFIFAGLMLSAAIVIRMVHYSLTTTAPWV